MNNKFIFWFLIIFWIIFIFFMSSMDANESNNKSKLTINGGIGKVIETTNWIGITDIHLSEMEMNQLVNKLNQPLRKVAHASEYCILAILLIIVLKISGIKEFNVFIFSIMMCFVYACMDEYHQTFVNGRTGQFTDCLIDTLGGIIGCLICFIVLIGRKSSDKIKKNDENI